MNSRSLFAIPAVLLLSVSGCLVTKSTYDIKAQETDSLRSALASLNREKAKLTEENADLSKQVADGKANEAALSAQVKEMDDSMKRLGEGLSGSRGTYDKGRITRGQFIDELLEGERATGRRMQELSARAEGCEKELARKRDETSILSGRVERIQEEDREASLMKNERLARVGADLAEVSPEIGVTPVGPSLRIVVPEKLLVGEKGAKLTKTGVAIVSKISEILSELPSASLLIITEGKVSAETVRSAASSNGQIQGERVQSRVREKGRGAEFLLVVR